MPTLLTQTAIHTNDTRLLTPADEAGIRTLTNGKGLLLAPGLRSLLRQNRVLGDNAGGAALQAAAALLPLYSETPLATAMHAAGYAADGQGAVLTPPCLMPGYDEVRHFLTVALRWAQECCAPYHTWAVLPFDPADPAQTEELCAQYLAAGLTLRGLCPLAEVVQLLVFAARPLPRWEEPVKRLHLTDPAMPRWLERGYAAAGFGWNQQGLVLQLRPTGE